MTLPEYHKILLMVSDQRALPFDDSLVIERRDWGAEAVAAAYAACGRGVDRPRIEARFKNGLSFYELDDHHGVVATTWILAGGYRYLDELGFLFPLDSQQAWIRDVFVTPRSRGQHVFARFVGTVLRRHYPEVRTVYSDVGFENRPSVRAHTHAGFATQSVLRGVRLSDVAMIRINFPPPQRNVVGYRSNRHFFLLGPAFRRFEYGRIA